ncbi:MAG: deoxyribodipyrimidine photo-lyase [Candidatus Goldbacteria bacterium]|nr:deoxyribodipyrimidine photo-lyase [Candidatus Goldiibacteriota bacterium]
MIQKERVKKLNGSPETKGKYVLYWMQASQRAEYNYALSYAAQKANELKLPLLAIFGLTFNYPSANYRHYAFMLQGLKETQISLKKKGIKLAIIKESPEKAAAKYSKNASCVVTDAGYTRVQRRWRKTAALKINCAFYQVETDVIVPVETASSKEEYGAATIRRKINVLLNDYIIPFKEVKPKLSSLNIKAEAADIGDYHSVLALSGLDKDVKHSAIYTGGTSEAKKHLKDFIENKLHLYADFRSHPDKNIESNLSPYLHFGQISPLYIAVEVLKTGGKVAGKFLDELIIRRELAVNFVYYNKNYENTECLPNWAKETLRIHSVDERPYVYTLKQLETGATHDKYWNAAQSQMVITGKMHNYMRMYWGKKIIEWSKTPEQAYNKMIYLNDKYELDGRDPNSYAGVAWCFGKHDRAWPQRKIFGKVRYMNDKGLERKFDMDTYVKMWNINRAGIHNNTKGGK